jgi:hypothetical protein
MSSLSRSNNPIEIIRQKTSATEPYLIDNFIDVIKKIYAYEIFKPMMDLVTTLAIQGRLTFKLSPKTVFELDEGNCRTVEMRGGNKFFTITIKKIKPDVIIHEIGHMIEGESGVSLDATFNRAIITDIHMLATRNISLQTAIKNVMVFQVANYPNNQKGSELFTRYFQLLAMAKEVAGFSAEYSYTVLDVYKAFPLTIDWIWNKLYKPMIARIDIMVAKTSQQFIIPIDEIKHKWADEKVEAFHKEKKGSKWSSNIKSIKD